MSEWYRILKKDRLFETGVKKMAEGSASSVNWPGDHNFYAWLEISTGNIVLVAGESEQYGPNDSQPAGYVRTQIYYPALKVTRTLGISTSGLYADPEDANVIGEVQTFQVALEEVAKTMAQKLGIPM